MSIFDPKQPLPSLSNKIHRMNLEEKKLKALEKYLGIRYLEDENGNGIYQKIIKVEDDKETKLDLSEEEINNIIGAEITEDDYQMIEKGYEP